MAKKTMMPPVNDLLLVEEALQRALSGTLKATASARASIESLPDISEYPIYQSLLELELDSDTEWDAFPHS